MVLVLDPCKSWGISEVGKWGKLKECVYKKDWEENSLIWTIFQSSVESMVLEGQRQLRKSGGRMPTNACAARELVIAVRYQWCDLEGQTEHSKRWSEGQTMQKGGASCAWVPPLREGQTSGRRWARVQSCRPVHLLLHGWAYSDGAQLPFLFPTGVFTPHPWLTSTPLLS